MMYILLATILSIQLFVPTFTFAEIEIEKRPKTAIIIDDFGGDVKGVEQFFTFDIPITVAIMPFMPHSSEQAERAHKNGLEVMLHLPLQPKKGKSSWLGPHAITSDLTTAEVKKRVRKAIANIPHVAGLNNHMGSLIVEDEKIMRAILEVAKEHNLYVIDSKTSPKSLIPTLAEELNIPWTSRDTFIDDTYSSSAHVHKQMLKLANLSIKQGQAIGIGHVGVKGIDTVNGIQQSLDYFKEKQIDIVPVSQLLPNPIEKNPATFWQNYEKEEDVS